MTQANIMDAETRLYDCDRNLRHAIELYNSQTDDLSREREQSRRYQNIVKRAIDYLSKEIDGDSPAIDQTLSTAIRILEGY